MKYFGQTPKRWHSQDTCVWFCSCASSVLLVLYYCMKTRVLCGFSVFIFGSDFVLASKKKIPFSLQSACLQISPERYFAPPQAELSWSFFFFFSFTVIFSTLFSEPFLAFVFEYIGTILCRCLRQQIGGEAFRSPGDKMEQFIKISHPLAKQFRILLPLWQNTSPTCHCFPSDDSFFGGEKKKAPFF